MTPRIILMIAAAFLLTLSGCGGSSSSSSTSGTLHVSLTDAASPDYQAVYVTVGRVEIKASTDTGENGWQSFDLVNKTINLLDLTGGILESLGTRDLAAGDYNQIRLILAPTPDTQININGTAHPFAQYVVDLTGGTHALKVPSGFQSGIKLVKRFTVEAAGLVELILDFDATKSVVKAGNSGKWLLKPVIRVIDTLTLAGIGGSVTDDTAPLKIAQQGVSVSAQTFNAGTAIPLGESITTHAGTLTDISGAYLLRLLAGDYTLVAVKDGFLPQCRRVTALTGTTKIEDFTLIPADSGTLTITIGGLTALDDSVTISVRQTNLCGSSLSTLYEVASPSFAEDGSYDISLPVGDYTVVAYGENHTPISVQRDILSNTTTVFNVAL